jgi:hypothetical protein
MVGTIAGMLSVGGLVAASDASASAQRIEDLGI